MSVGAFFLREGILKTFISC